jgi:hemolysin activation/secretion protein
MTLQMPPLPVLMSFPIRVGWLLAVLWTGLSANAQESAQAEDVGSAQTMYVQEYRVIGARKLARRDVEKAVYPFLGPERTPEDVDLARAALEKAYRDQGFQTVSVLIPQQKVKKGVIILEVVEAEVGRLRVHGSRYYDIERLKRKAPSLAEGNVPNFNDVSRDIVALNQQSGLRVTPALRAGLIPGTVDIDLNVEDELPLHGSLEVNNRYNAGTTPWRINGGLSYTNLWQQGHTLGFNFQVAPERLEDARVFSGYYLLPVPGQDRWSLILQAMKQDSDVSTLGGAAVAGRGEVYGIRANVRLPAEAGFYHSLSLGADYKSFDEDITLAGSVLSSPVTYYPLSLNYTAVWAGKKNSTELNAGVVFSLRGQGTDSDEFAIKRYNADDGFFYFRGDLSHTRKLKGDFEAYGKVQGQVSSSPLINNEQYAGGGLGNVRGYLESTALGDNGVFGTVELRSPSLLKMNEQGNNEWRFYVFADAGRLTLNDPLPEQADRFDFASVGIGSRFRVLNHLNGSLDAGIPLIQQSTTRVGELLLTVRFWADF